MADNVRRRIDASAGSDAAGGIPPSPEFAARVAAWIYAGGALMSGLVLLLPHTSQLDEARCAAVGLIAAIAAAVLRLRAGRLPDWALPVACAIGTLMISADILFSGEREGGPATNLELFYMWVALYAAYFFTRREVAVQLLLIGAAYLAALLIVAPGAVVATRLAETLGTVTVAAVLVQLLRDRVAQLVTQLTDAARTDPLTGLLNRRGFEELMEVEVERAQRTGRPLSVLVGDLDKFKQVNDHLGHAGGDSALIRISDILEYGKRQIDGIARTGGEEFAIVLPDTDKNAAYAIAERLRTTVEKAFAHKFVPLTFSFGVATFPQHAPTARALLIAADQGLYGAKELGRNMSVIFSDEVASIVSSETRESADRAESHLSTLMSLAEALDLRDMGTAEHCQTVGRYAALIAQELELSETRVERIRIAGVLHDVGKIGLPDAILKKPGPLTKEEWEQVRKHPEIGAGILGSRSFDDIRAWVLAHHERPDGRGYPYGLSEHDIPLEARIVAVADAYEAMTADRPYRDAMGHEVARAELLGRAGTGFDARVVSALLAALDRDDQEAEEADTPATAA